MMRTANIIKLGILVGISVVFFTTSNWCFAAGSKEESNKVEEKKDSSYSYGRYQLSLGAMRTVYKEDLHKTFYPTPQWGGNIGCDYYYFRKYIGLGLQFKMGFYKDKGYPSKSKEKYEKDDSISLSRPIFPMSLSLVLNLTPFMDKVWFIPKKILSVKAWFGGEYVYGQEQRDSGEKSYVNGVRKRSIVFGVSPSIRLSFWGRSDVNTLFVLNIKDLYLSPYMEWTKEVGAKKTISFDRKIFGIQLSFETI